MQKVQKSYDIGETKRSLRERSTEHRQATNNPDHASASTAVLKYFNLPSHSIKDMLLIPLELQTSNNPSRRKAREANFIQRGQTLSSDGINRRNERLLFRFIHCNLYFYLFIYLSRGNRTNKISAIFFMFVCVFVGGTTRCTIDCQVEVAECHVSCSQSTTLRLMSKSTQKPLDGDNTGQGVIFDHANKRCAV